jgi:hypothetical protein
MDDAYQPIGMEAVLHTRSETRPLLQRYTIIRNSGVRAFVLLKNASDRSEFDSVLASLLDFRHHESVIERMIDFEHAESYLFLYSTALARAHDLGYPVYDTAIKAFKRRRNIWFYGSGGEIKRWLRRNRCRQVHSLLWLAARVARKHAPTPHDALPVP